MKYSIHYVAETESTMDYARELVADGCPSFSVAWTRRQTKGRGRFGRTWQGFSRNVMATIILRSEDAREGELFLPYIAALAISDVVRALLPFSHVSIKWPNDVLVNDAKVSGLLIEKQSDPDVFLVGVGINVGDHPPPGTVMFPATSISAVLQRDVAVADVLHRLVEQLWQRCQAWRAGGFREHLRDEYSGLLWRLNSEVSVSIDKQKQKTITGVNLGLSKAGALRLLLPEGEKEFFVGDVS